MPDARVLGDLEGAAEVLRSREDSTGKVGCIGFCMGGRYTLLFACSSDRLDAAVDCWGGFIDSATPDERSTPERPTPPLELAEQLSCPLLAAVGAEDQNPSPQIAEQLRERAATSGQRVKVDVYEGAGHAFFADYRPTYRAEPAASCGGGSCRFSPRRWARPERAARTRALRSCGAHSPGRKGPAGGDSAGKLGRVENERTARRPTRACCEPAPGARRCRTARPSEWGSDGRSRTAWRSSELRGGQGPGEPPRHRLQ